MQIPVLGLRVLQRDHTEKTSLANHGRPVLLIIGETSAHVWISSKRCANKYNNSLTTCNMYSMKCGKPNHKPTIWGMVYTTHEKMMILGIFWEWFSALSGRRRPESCSALWDCPPLWLPCDNQRPIPGSGNTATRQR